MTRLRICVPLLALIAMTGACARPGVGTSTGGTEPGGGEPGTSDAIAATGQDCDSAGVPPPAGPRLEPLPADSVLVSVTRCVFEPRPVRGDGEWMFRLRQRGSGDLVRLAAALRLPSEQSTGAACAAIRYVPIVITVTDRLGREITPSLPHSGCGEPLPPAVESISALTWTTFDTTKISQTRSQLEIDSNCSGAYKPVIALLAADAIPGTEPRIVHPELTLTSLRVCRYNVAKDPSLELSVAGSGPLYGGRLVAASTLDGARARAFLSAVAAAPPVAGACAKPQAPFADVWPPAGGAHVTIELGGCYRVLIDGENYLRQLRS